MPTPALLPLFPLHTVLYPGGLLPLQIFEARYVDLVRDCLRTGTGFGVVPIKQGRETGPAARPWLAGTLAEIVDWDQGTNGLLRLIVRGTERFTVTATQVQKDQLLLGEVSWLTPVARIATDSEFTELRALLHKLHQSPVGDAETPVAAPPDNLDLAWRIAERLPFPVAQKMALLLVGDDRQLLNEMTRLLGAAHRPDITH